MSVNSAPLRLAVDARDLARDHRGLGRYARAILRRFVRRDDLDLTLLVRPSFFTRRTLANVLGSWNFSVSSRIPKGCELVWHPWNGIFVQGAGAQVTTIADVAPFRFPASQRRRREHEQAPFRNAVARASRIITFSQASKGDVIELLGARPEATAVTHLGVEEFFAPGAPELILPALRPKEYYLFVGDPAEPRKNFAQLYRAFCQAWPRDGPSLAVLCARDPTLRGVVHVGLDTEDIHNTNNARLRALYRGALATLVPSLYEGFGMPVIESMACGTPVIAADASSLPEIAGDAALLVDPSDEGAWTEALHKIAEDRSMQDLLRRRGLVNARRFTWDACADQTLWILRAAAANHLNNP